MVELDDKIDGDEEARAEIIRDELNQAARDLLSHGGLGMSGPVLRGHTPRVYVADATLEEDKLFPMSDSRCAVGNKDTRLRSQEWLLHQLEAQAERDG